MSFREKIGDPSDTLISWTIYVMLTIFCASVLIGIGFLVYSSIRDSNLEYDKKVQEAIQCRR